MYLMKRNVVNIENQKNFAEIIGISEETLSRIISRKQKCSKMTAYCITKIYDQDKEILDFFERVD